MRHLELRRGTRLLALRVHCGLVTGNVNALAALARHVGSEVDRKPERVVQGEDGFAIDQVALPAKRAFEDLHAVFQRFGKAFLLCQQGFLDTLRCSYQFRIGRAHLQHEILHQLVKERPALAQLVAMAQGAANDPAQYVATPVVGRNHAVDDQEAAGANVVRNHLQGRQRQVITAGFTRGSADQALEQVDFIVAVHMLQHRCDALESHAGVNAGLGQARHGAIGLTVELHEHQVPDLDIAIAIGIR